MGNCLQTEMVLIVKRFGVWVAACFLSSEYEKPVTDLLVPSRTGAFQRKLVLMYALGFFKMRKTFLSPLCWLHWRRAGEEIPRMISKHVHFQQGHRDTYIYRNSHTHSHVLHTDHTQRHTQACPEITQIHTSARWLKGYQLRPHTD